MSACTSRLYADAHDLDSILALLHRVRAPERCTDYPAPADLRELLSVPDIQANTRLWETEGGQLCAFALVDTYHNLLFEFERDTVTPELLTDLIQWGVACRRRQPTEEGEPVTLDFCCSAEDEERLALLIRHGFTQQPTRTLGLKRLLHEPIPEPVLPAGFTLRPTTGQDEVEAWVALHRAAWGTEHMTVEERSAMLSGPDYDPELDLVVVAPDGRLLRLLDQPGRKCPDRAQGRVHRSGGDAPRLPAARIGPRVTLDRPASAPGAGGGNRRHGHQQRKREDAAGRRRRRFSGGIHRGLAGKTR